MPNPSSLLDRNALVEGLPIAQLVPEAHAAYRPLLMDGLLFFLERLPPPRLAQIFAEQLQLPRAASPARRLVTLLRQCPTLHKLGQVMARHRRLAPELRANLQWLESLEPTTPMGAITAVIQRELGAVAGLEIASTALAEASVAVVVPVVWRCSAASAPLAGVLKVLRPGVEEQMHEELAIWSSIGVFLEERCADYGLPVLDYRNTLDSVRRLLANEIRLDREQAHLARAAAFHADSPAVLIPGLLPFCTARLTAMERVEGRKVTDPGLSASERRRLARTLIEAMIAKPFWSDSSASAVFHADPHAGNLLVTRDGRLAILDWALVTSLGKAQRSAVVQAVACALTQDEAGLSRALAALGRPSDPATLDAVIAAGLRQVRQGMFPGMEWLMALLDRLGTAGAMQFPEELTLFRKALLTLSGVISDVSGQPSIDEVLVMSGLMQFGREWAARPFAPFDSRAFGTHWSNADGFALWAGWPLTVSRYWAGLWRDALATGEPAFSPLSSSSSR